MLTEKGVKWIIHRNFALVTGIIVCRPERDGYNEVAEVVSLRPLRVRAFPENDEIR